MFRKVYIHRAKANRKQSEREKERKLRSDVMGAETDLPHPGLTNQGAHDGPSLPLNLDAATVRPSVWAHSHSHLKKRKARRHAGLVSRTP